MTQIRFVPWGVSQRLRRGRCRWVFALEVVEGAAEASLRNGAGFERPGHRGCDCPKAVPNALSTAGYNRFE